MRLFTAPRPRLCANSWHNLGGGRGWGLKANSRRWRQFHNLSFRFAALVCPLSFFFFGHCTFCLLSKVMNQAWILEAHQQHFPSIYEASSDKCDIKYNQHLQWTTSLALPKSSRREFSMQTGQREPSLSRSFRPFVMIHLTYFLPFLFLFIFSSIIALGCAH